MRRGYAEGGVGQVHYREAGPADTGQKMPVVLFHETPTSSIQFEMLLRELGSDRLAFAPDTPGYGMSDGPTEPLLVGEYVAALAVALEARGFGRGGLGKAAVFGFHTGSLLAAELALQRPDMVAAVILAGVPFRPVETRRQRLADLPGELDPASYREKVEWLYRVAVETAPADIPLHERTQIFASMILPGDRYWWAYNGVWRFDYEQRLPTISQPLLLLASKEELLEQRAVGRMIPDANIVEFPHAHEWVLRNHAAEFAAAIRNFLDT